MIKKYNQFIKESKLQISEEDMNLFSTEPQLQKLISDQKVRLYNKEITFDGNDKQTKEILDQYINKKITESFDDEDDEDEHMTVKELIEMLSECDPNSKVYYTLGGSGNYGPVTLFEDDSYELSEEDKPGVLIGELTW